MSFYKSSLYPAILKQIRNQLAGENITQAEVGRILGIKQSAVSSLLSGKTCMSLKQLLDFCDLLGIRLQYLASIAENAFVETRDMTDKLERAVYQTPLHVLCYCAATIEVLPSSVRVEGAPLEQVEACFADLLQAGVIKQTKKGSYIQLEPGVTLRPKMLNQKIMDAHRKIAMWSSRRHQKLKEEGATTNLIADSYELDRFSPSQIAELNSLIEQFYEKIQMFQNSNHRQAYNSSEDMKLWNIHLMIVHASDNPMT
jgi:predicted transcriptional regulator